MLHIHTFPISSSDHSPKTINMKQSLPAPSIMPFTFIRLTFIRFAAFSIFFASCKSSSVEPTGTFIRTSDTELSVLTDTIKISPSNSYSDNLYNITRSSSTYFKNPKDSQFNKYNKPNTITGTLNPAKAQLETEDPGIVYSISNDGKSISINGIEYKKMN